MPSRSSAHCTAASDYFPRNNGRMMTVLREDDASAGI